MAKIYTKGGDKGTTALIGGARVPKNDARITSYGTVDELNSFIGVALEFARKDSKADAIARQLETIQHWLFDLGSLLAAVPEDREKFALRPISAAHVSWLETRIDDATAVLAPLKNFVLPSGTQLSAALHVARTVARRAERVCLDPAIADELPDGTIPFLNRLSDYLFTMARFANHVAGVADVAWEKRDPQ